MDMKKGIFTCLVAVALAAHGQNSPYVAKVFDFCPAPGQFVNELPEYEPGDDKEAILAKAAEYIVGQENGGLLSLGSWGGYIVVGFDHTIANVPGGYDFKVNANAFYAAANPKPDAPLGGSCEPGIVMVSYDANGNGLPDDAWYELAGSEYHKLETRHNYQVVYYKPAPDKVATPHPDNTFLNDTSYIFWKDNRGECGYVERNTFHKQSYYPEWIDADSLVFSGSRLADNGVDESGVGNYYVLYAYGWGYVDNHPNTTDLSNFKIDWAVDADGNPVWLPGVDFIKIYTGVLQMNGWLGECSTEVSGIVDLHPDVLVTSVGRPATDDWWVCSGDGFLRIEGQCPADAVLLDLSGRVAASFRLVAGENICSTAGLHRGVYMLRMAAAASGTRTCKIIIR